MNRHDTPKNKYDLYMKVEKLQKRLERKVAIRCLLERIKKVIHNE